MRKRKSPIRHHVRSHFRQGRRVRDFFRGHGYRHKLTKIWERSAKRRKFIKEYTKIGKKFVRFFDVQKDVLEFNKKYKTNFRIFAGLKRKGVSADIDVITSVPMDEDLPSKLAFNLRKKYDVKVDVFYPPDKNFKDTVEKLYIQQVRKAIRQVKKDKDRLEIFSDEDFWKKVGEYTYNISVESEEVEELEMGPTYMEGGEDRWNVTKEGKLLIPDYLIFSSGGGFAFARGAATKKGMRTKRLERLKRETKWWVD